jgi:hypothetical protein
LAVPSAEDLAKKRSALEDHQKHLDEAGKLTEKKLTSMLRSAIRQVWMKAPNKLAKLEMERIADMDPNTRTKWLFKCAICGGMFKQTDVEIDHKCGNHSFTKLDDFPNFCDKILNAPHDELQVLCKHKCHATKTYAEKQGISFEEAIVEKKVVAFGKKPANGQKSTLVQLGLPEGKNANERKNIYREYLKSA